MADSDISADQQGQGSTKRDIADWDKVWSQPGTPTFHNTDPTPSLVKYFDSHLKQNKDEPSVFVPLCGKSVDMKWLYDKGCRVVGLEASMQAVKAFFSDSRISYTECDWNNMRMLQSKDGRMKVIVGDLFNLTSEMFEKPFDLVVDRASLIAINQNDRSKLVTICPILREKYGILDFFDPRAISKYLEILQSITSDQCRVLQLLVDYDKCGFKGPPHLIEYEILSATYYPAPEFSIHYMDSIDCLGSVQSQKWGLKYFNEETYLILRHAAGKSKMDDTIVEDSGWAERWELGKIGWHQDIVHPFLTSYFVSHLMPTNSKGDAQCRVFVPLCGKTVDLAWLHSLGCVVVGVEFSETAALAFFQEHPEFSFTCHTFPGGKIYKVTTTTGRNVLDRTIGIGRHVDTDLDAECRRFLAKIRLSACRCRLIHADRSLMIELSNSSTLYDIDYPGHITINVLQAERLSIFVCNLFDTNKEILGGAFDVIWDRGALVAINVDMRQKYAHLMQSLLRPDSKMLISLFDYDFTKWGGPPHHLGKHDLIALYPPCKLKCELLDKVNAHNEARLAWGSDFITEDAWLIRPSTS